jgi:hypothetical protein
VLITIIIIIVIFEKGLKFGLEEIRKKFFDQGFKKGEKMSLEIDFKRRPRKRSEKRYR